MPSISNYSAKRNNVKEMMGALRLMGVIGALKLDEKLLIYPIKNKLGPNRRFSPKLLESVKCCPRAILLGQLQPTLGCCFRGRVCSGRCDYLTSRATTRGLLKFVKMNSLLTCIRATLIITETQVSATS